MTAKTNRSAPKAKAAAAPAANAKVFTLAALARDLKVDPKVARAKARRNADQFGKLRSKGADNWTFPVARREAVSQLLTGNA